MKRQAINPPNNWSGQYEFHQAEIISEINQLVKFSGQTSLVTDPDSEMGISVNHPDDMRKQIEVSLASIDDLLERAGMKRENIIHVHFFTTEMEAFLNNYDVYVAWIGEADIKPPQSTLGVDQLAVPDLKIEIEVTAAN